MTALREQIISRVTRLPKSSRIAKALQLVLGAATIALQTVECTFLRSIAVSVEAPHEK
jgi:hypothetical protein